MSGRNRSRFVDDDRLPETDLRALHIPVGKQSKLILLWTALHSMPVRRGPLSDRRATHATLTWVRRNVWRTLLSLINSVVGARSPRCWQAQCRRLTPKRRTTPPPQLWSTTASYCINDKRSTCRAGGRRRSSALHPRIVIIRLLSHGNTFAPDLAQLSYLLDSSWTGTAVNSKCLRMRPPRTKSQHLSDFRHHHISAHNKIPACSSKTTSAPFTCEW